MGTTPTLVKNLVDTYVSANPSRSTRNASSEEYLYADAATGYTNRTLIFFSLPFPQGIQILSAKLHLFQRSVQSSGTRTLTLARMNSGWSTARLTWANHPASIGAAASLSRSNPLPNSEWIIDVTSQMQSVANGAPWYGFRILGNSTTPATFYSSQSRYISTRPYMEITWAENPKTPTSLYPSGGRAVSTPKPVVQCDFTDLAGDRSMQAIQVQTASDANFANNLWDSGVVLASQPELDLGTTTFPAMANGQVIYWRVRVQDGSGLWSAYSAAAQFAYQSLGVLTITNPSSTTVYRNDAKNPRATSTNGWTSTAAGGATLSTSLVNDANSAPLVDAPTYFRQTFTNPVTSPGTTLRCGAANGAFGTAALPGQLWSASAFIRASWLGAQYRLRVDWFNSSGTNLGGSFVTPAKTLVAGEWTGMKIQSTLAPASTAFMGVTAELMEGGFPVSGSTFDMTAVMAIQDPYLPTAIDYWDGASVADVDWAFAWVGTAHQSSSNAIAYAFRESTPPITWTFTGRTQSAYMVRVWRLAKIMGGPGRGVSLGQTGWTSGKITSNATSITIPPNVLTTMNDSYRLEVVIWDTVARETVPNGSITTTKSLTGTYLADGVLDVVTELAATAITPFAYIGLTWKRTSLPDFFNIVRNGKIIATLPGTQLFVSGTSYKWIDRKPLLREEATYQVIPVVNAVSAIANPAVKIIARSLSSCLSGVDGENGVIILNAKNDLKIVSSQVIYQRPSVGPPVMLSGNARGYQGTVTGTLGPVGNIPARVFKDRFLALTAEDRGPTLSYLMIDESFECFIANATIIPDSGSGGVIYRVSFDIYQTDYSA